MQIGIIEQFDENKIKKMVETKTPFRYGIIVDSLLDEINVLEIKHQYQFNLILMDLKFQLMEFLGKVKIEKGEDKNGSNTNARDEGDIKGQRLNDELP